MAMARKCDRCGDYYTPRMGETVNAIRLMDLKYANGVIDRQRKQFDLCPRCVRELELWLYIKEDQDGGDV